MARQKATIDKKYVYKWLCERGSGECKWESELVVRMQ